MLDDNKIEGNNDTSEKIENINGSEYKADETEEDEKAQESSKESDRVGSGRTIKVGDFILEMKHIEMPNPMTLVRQLYELRSNKSMTKEEKEKEVIKITKEFTR